MSRAIIALPHHVTTHESCDAKEVEVANDGEVGEAGWNAMADVLLDEFTQLFKRVLTFAFSHTMSAGGVI